MERILLPIKLLTIAMIKLSFAASALLLAALVGCAMAPSGRSQTKDKYQIESLAEFRCLVETGLFDRAMTEEMAAYKLENAPDQAWKDHWAGVIDAQKNGLSEEDYKSLTLSEKLKDCRNTVVTWLAVEFPSDRASRFTSVLMAEGFFDNPPKKLTQTLFALCSGKYKPTCSVK